MRKTKMKLPAILLVTAVAVTACSPGGEQAQTSEPQVEANNGFANGKFDPPITLTTVGAVGATHRFKNGETLDNNVHTKWAKEKLGIDIKYNWVTSNDQFMTKVRLDLSANTKLPDVIHVADPQLLNDLIESEKFVDITSAFEKYASPKVKQIYSQDPLYWAQVTKDGKRYGLPTLSRAHQNDTLLWLRTDWLKKLNLEPPKTFDDLEKIMEAMQKTDFGKGPVKPPLAISIKDANMPFVQWRGDASWIFGGYGVIPHYWNKWNGDKLEYGSVQPEMKQALAKMQEWFKKGYLSPDVGLIDVGKSDETFRNEKSGIMTGPPFQSTVVRNALQKNNPAAEAKPIPIPAGPTGKPGLRNTTVPGGAFLINKDFKHIDAFFLYINKLYEMGDPAKGSEYENGYFEGYDYVMKDGKPSSIEADFPDKTKINTPIYFLGGQAFQDPELEIKSLIKLYNGEKPSTPYETKLYNAIPEAERADSKNVIEWQAAYYTLQQKENTMPNLFLGPPTKTMKSKWEGLLKMESETFLKIVYGKAPIDEFDNFVKNWKAMGGDEITEEVNAWYKTSVGK
ncbi:extracellular solute-binding protein [Paenibacillus mucilaginosus]|uniref:Family 1 extracellular solute-binding protein n=2 Tax=Paenibacillus mucilaginosus TaxID=61624 RepID=H6NCL2_9BACL|nr:extracellular solute-binding protein [Paenibacillus mucilaginosus]AEI40307.1 extracellular solute-binding protein family 1 [Paenibacillus mucilaginosus KNP414]AFC28941.1 family 1 extracellular solute-binding protein [Paenibacillus mucilaginosus 3016]MCG7213333.1 extracellular solute-binding protein [Paenibacillus mucilaginosus]WDM29515.1 extracellular solute-binding protein [Paenibacillus mucilaginosus]WFA17691.1 extracellular solute-binding protein [Paenibacillus mucilaginosus]